MASISSAPPRSASARETTYRVLCAVVGTLFTVGGLAFLFAFLRYQAPGGTGFFGLGPGGHYFVAFAGSALVGWGGCLLGAVRHPASSRGIGTATAAGLVLSACYRMIAWVVGDYAALGSVLLVEAALFLLLALAFVWLRPAAPMRGDA